MWTEHVPNEQVLDSKVFPRMLAMAEVLLVPFAGQLRPALDSTRPR